MAKDTHTMTAVLSYLGILWIIPFLIVKKRDDFEKFHISQGINLFILEVIVLVVLGILAMIPVIGIAFSVLYWIAMAFFVIVFIIAIVKGVQGEKWSIPIVSGARFVKLK